MIGNRKVSSGTFRSRLGRLALDLAPLRERDFRLLWIGEICSEIGSNITLVAVLLQVDALTHDPAAVGLIGLVQLVPLMAASLFGGSWIDRYDRRRLLLYAQIGQAAASGVLLAATFLTPAPLVLVYLGAGLVAGLSGFSLATRSAMTPSLVPPDRLPSALALNQVMWNTAQIVGPAVGGLIVGGLGYRWAYGIDVLSFSGTIGAALLMSPRPPIVGHDPAAEVLGSWRRLGEGFRYLRSKRILQATFFIDLVAMIFGMPRVLFPVLARTRFGAGPELAGLLFAAVSVGAVVAALTSGWVHRVRRQGAAIVIAVVVWGLAIAGFGLVGNRVVVALLLLAVAGGADVVSAVFRSTILQASVPDALRGRLSGIHISVVAGGPRLGDLEGGLVASATSPAFSVVSGGLLCVVGAVALALALPGFWR
ncbi:MAG: MFS transporter, partial [Acidimicrobiia bacterium]